MWYNSISVGLCVGISHHIINREYQKRLEIMQTQLRQIESLIAEGTVVCRLSSVKVEGFLNCDSYHFLNGDCNFPSFLLLIMKKKIDTQDIDEFLEL